MNFYNSSISVKTNSRFLPDKNSRIKTSLKLVKIYKIIIDSLLIININRITNRSSSGSRLYHNRINYINLCLIVKIAVPSSYY